MKDLPEHELLSAHLDGELTIAEQARVERFLAESPSARRTLKELRSLSTTIQGLPKLRLDADLSDRVLHQAERAILAGPATSKESPIASGDPLPRAQRWSRLLRRVVASRGVAWSAAALAIALLIMLTSTPEPERVRDVALAPESSIRRPALRAREQPPATGELWPSDEASEAFHARDAEAEPPAMPDGVASREDAAPLETEMDAASSGIAPPEPAPPGPAAPEAEVAAPRMAPAMPLDAPEELDASEVAAEAPPGALETKRRTEAGFDDYRQDFGGMTRRSGRSGMPADAPVLLVQCDITPEAARQGALDDILASQQIAPASDRSRPERADMDVRPQAGPRGAARLSRAERSLAPAEPVAPEWDDAFDVVYFEATPEQVAGALNRLTQLPDQFLAVSVKPAPGVPSQQGLTRFNRRPTDPTDGRLEKRERVHADMLAGEPEVRRDVAVGDERQMRMFSKAVADSDHLDAMPAEDAGADDAATDWYRVLFVLRVVPPDLIAAPAAVLDEPPADADTTGTEVDAPVSP